MKTYLECIPCFLNQALKVMDLHSVDYKTKEKVMRQIMIKLPKINLNCKPPEFALLVYKTIENITGNSDLYKKIKKKDNLEAIGLLPEIKEIMKSSADTLKDTINVAISGNVMDFAVNHDYNILKTIKKSISSGFVIDDYKKLKKDIQKAKSIVYIADNAGEIVFDRLLIEEIRKISDANITFLVRARPIINDATLEDARMVGLHKMANIRLETIKTIFPIINNSSKGFVNFLKKADLIISKGQANYECLSEMNLNIYFLLIAKCPVIARNIGVQKGSFICKCNKH
ncbi:MAG: DUF89 family protein [Nanoarchaeota archaeon]|nr:DUF89 family protein [Nanoarchaeota archaeon]